MLKGTLIVFDYSSFARSHDNKEQLSNIIEEKSEVHNISSISTILF